MIIGLTGRIASGKTEVAEFLKEKGFNYITISWIVREEAKKRNIEITRKNLQDLGNNIRKEEGAGGWTIRLLKTINANDDWIIDGIRNPGEVKELRKLKDFILLSVNAPQEIRYQRVLSRNKESDPKDWKGFLEMDNRDFGEKDPLGQQVGECMSLADFHIDNNSTLDDFHRRIYALYESIIKEEP